MATPEVDPATPRITFAGQRIISIVLPYTIPSPDLQIWRTQFAATQGISEIIGGSGGRMIEIPLVVRSVKWTTRASLEAYIEELNRSTIGVNGELKIEPAYALREPLLDDDGNPIGRGESPIIIYADCTCHGFSMMRGPLQDSAGTMRAGAGRWNAVVMGRFFQLSNV